MISSGGVSGVAVRESCEAGGGQRAQRAARARRPRARAHPLPPRLRPRTLPALLHTQRYTDITPYLTFELEHSVLEVAEEPLIQRRPISPPRVTSWRQVATGRKTNSQFFIP